VLLQSLYVLLRVLPAVPILDERPFNKINSTMHVLPSTILALISTALAIDDSQSCRTSSLPNPIASQYYANITGQINGTLALLPIPIALARRIIPAEYEILSEQYEAMMPDLPKGMYPALLQAVFDHDIRYMDYQMPDFSVRFFQNLYLVPVR
jgi:hypothetical protein